MSAQAASGGPPSAACAEFLTHCYPKGCAKTRGPRYRRCSLWRDKRTFSIWPGDFPETSKPKSAAPHSPSLLEQPDAPTPNTSKGLQLLLEHQMVQDGPICLPSLGRAGRWCARSLGLGRPKTSSICCASPTPLPVGKGVIK